MSNINEKRYNSIEVPNSRGSRGGAPIMDNRGSAVDYGQKQMPSRADYNRGSRESLIQQTPNIDPVSIYEQNKF